METKSKEDLTMKANEFSQASTQTKCAKNKVVAVIGRWMPIHEGHKRFLMCKKFEVTHFCTGNKEDILDVLDSRGEDLGMEFINPEQDSDFPYHATDIRNMIIKGEYEKLEGLIPEEIKPILFRYTFKEILAASQKRGIHFMYGN